jgi:hypothetical protein
VNNWNSAWYAGLTGWGATWYGISSPPPIVPTRPVKFLSAEPRVTDQLYASPRVTAVTAIPRTLQIEAEPR